MRDMSKTGDDSIVVIEMWQITIHKVALGKIN